MTVISPSTTETSRASHVAPSPQGPDHRRRHRRARRRDPAAPRRHRVRDLRGLALFERHRRRPSDRAERHACPGGDRACERIDQPRLGRGSLRLLFAGRREARLDQPRHGPALRPAGRQHLTRRAERDPDRQGLVRLRLALFREAPDQDRGSRRPADHRLLFRRHHRRRRLPDRPTACTRLYAARWLRTGRSRSTPD
ncbi:hypothetical protein ACVIU7_007226 [Bradyrhizobium liaoningense]